MSDQPQPQTKSLEEKALERLTILYKTGTLIEVCTTCQTNYEQDGKSPLSQYIGKINGKNVWVNGLPMLNIALKSAISDGKYTKFIAYRLCPLDGGESKDVEIIHPGKSIDEFVGTD